MKHIAQADKKVKPLYITALEAIEAYYKVGMISKETYRHERNIWMEHDCKASPDDGCGFCGELFEYGLYPEVDPKEEE